MKDNELGLTAAATFSTPNAAWEFWKNCPALRPEERRPSGSRCSGSTWTFSLTGAPITGGSKTSITVQAVLTTASPDGLLRHLQIRDRSGGDRNGGQFVSARPSEDEVRGLQQADFPEIDVPCFSERQKQCDKWGDYQMNLAPLSRASPSIVSLPTALTAEFAQKHGLSRSCRLCSRILLAWS